MKKLVVLLSLFLVSSLTKSQITADPNPFDQRSLLTYTLTAGDTLSLVVYDMTGKNVLTIKEHVYLGATVYQDSLLMDAFSQGVYIVALMKRAGEKALATCKIVKTGATSIPVVSASGEIRLFPNPTTQKARIDLGSMRSNVHVLLYDEIGHLLYEDHISGNAIDLDLGPYAHGLYSLKVSDETEQKIYKLIKE